MHDDVTTEAKLGEGIQAYETCIGWEVISYETIIIQKENPSAAKTIC